MPISFLFPEFLFASLLISIPILIHLFNFRRFKKIYFTNVKFLKELQTETQQRSKLKHLLVLLARILTILFLVFAFSQPFIPVGNAGPVVQQRIVSVFIDNSFSMEQEGNNGTLLDEAKAKAEAIAQAYSPSDRYHLLTQDFESRHQRNMSRDEFLEAVQEVKPTASVHMLHEILNRQKEALQDFEVAARKIYMLTDLQKTGIDLTQLNADTLNHINMIPLVGQTFRNISIDTCWINTPAIQPGARVELNVRLKNFSETDESQIPLKLSVNGSQRAISSVDISGNGESEVVLSFTVNESGWQNCQLSISDHPITFDDTYYLSFPVSEVLNVLTIISSGDNQNLNAVYSTDPYYKQSQTEVTKVDYGSLSKYDLIILQGLDMIPSGLSASISELVKQGGTVCVVPGTKADLGSYQSFLSNVDANYLSGSDTQYVKVNAIDIRNELFKDVFEKAPDNIEMPWTKKRYLLSLNTRISGENLMTYTDGQVFLKKFNSGNGKVYLFTSSLSASESNFSSHALFVPVFLRLALLSRQDGGNANIIGRDRSISIPIQIDLQGDKVAHLINKENQFDIIPEIKNIGRRSFLEIYDQIKDAGIYELNHNEKAIWNYAFNFDRKESDPKIYTIEELKNFTEQAGITQISFMEGGVKNFEKFISESEKGISLWKICILLALVFIGIEVLLLKFMKS